MNRLQGNLTLDTSVMVEYLIGSKLGEKVRDYFANLKPDERAYCSLYTLSEIFYIMCRLKGKKFAHEKIDQMLLSNMISIHSSIELAMKTGELKCERAISLADCSSIATAVITNTKVVFTEEEELKREIARKPFELEIIFLE
ncbi:MAG: PIN domain-containing protein [Nitrososphaerales archaeon]